MAAAMLEFRTPGFNPYAVQYSPYYDSRIAVAAAANFGLVGNGRLYALSLTAEGIQVEKSFDTNDCIYDLAWSELNENQVIVACGDGSLKLFDLAVDVFPVVNLHEHKREVFSVCWNTVTKDTFVSSSWDGTVKLWTPTRNASLATLPIGSCTYSASFSPSNPSLLSAVSSDSCLRLFDMRTPSSAKNHLARLIPVHEVLNQQHHPQHQHPQHQQHQNQPAELLTHDWNKYNHNLIATAGVDRVIRLIDIRGGAPGGGGNGNGGGGGGPSSDRALHGHDYAIRKIAWSPHASHLLLSAGYDMTVRLWNDGSPSPAGVGHQMGIMNHHTEFVTGLDWCLFGAGGWVASAGWDERVLLWDANLLMRRR